MNRFYVHRISRNQLNQKFKLTVEDLGYGI